MTDEHARGRSVAPRQPLQPLVSGPLVSRRLVLGAAGAGALAWVASACSPTTRTTDEDGSPRAALPQPTGHIVTRWRDDPFAFGSYSYLAVGASPGDRSTIAAPIEGRIHIAGEATDREHPATVHGALQAGRDAAEAALTNGARRVVVVGAGIAGIGAARLLADAGVEVEVIEGRDRIGGRIHTDGSLGVPLDLGASWIHGVRGNPLTDLADASGAARVATDYDNAEVRDARGSVVAEGDVPDRFVEILEVENEYAADVGQLDPGFADEGADDRGGDVTFPQGYVQLVDHLAAGIEITTGVVVDQIVLTGEGVTVNAGAASASADAVIVSVPLGVLQRDVITFDPPLPARTREAIDRLGMGHLSKVYLRFDEVFWDPDVELVGYLSAPLGRFPVWFNMYPSTGEPILLAFHGGSAADALNELTDAQIVDDAMAALTSMYLS